MELMLSRGSFRYWIGGIIIEINAPIDAFPAAVGAAVDSRIRLESAPMDPGRYRASDDSDGRWIAIPEAVAAEGWIHTTGRNALLYSPSAEVTQRSGLVRQIAPFLAGLLGTVVLHAAGVAVSDVAYVFIGASGVGKSTLAVELGGMGLNVFADDLSPVRFSHGSPRILTPPPPEAESADFPLRRAYFLRRGSREGGIREVRLAPTEAIALFMRNGFGELRVRRIWKTQFDCYVRLVRSVPCRLLIVPDDLAALRDDLSRAKSHLMES